MNFSIFSLYLYEVAEPILLFNSRNERASSALPLLIRQLRVLSHSHSIVFLISARIALYRYRKSGLQRGENHCCLYYLNLQVILYLQCFHSSSLFGSRNTNIIIYIIPIFIWNQISPAIIGSLTSINHMIDFILR